MAKDSETIKDEKGDENPKTPKGKKPPGKKADGSKKGPPKQGSKADGGDKKPAPKKKPETEAKDDSKESQVDKPTKAIAELPEVKIETFNSDKVKVEMKKEPHCRISMKVEATEPVMKEGKKVALRKIAKEVSIPGFRKGKAPSNIIEKKFARDVSQEWEREFANIAFREAQQLAQQHLLNGNGNISYKMEKMTPDSGQIVFNFEAEPEVPEIEASALELKNVDTVVIDDERIDETVKSIQMFYATWNQIEERGAKEGDFVILDIDDMDQDPPVQAFSNNRFEVKENGMANWMRELIIGKMKGESIEGTSAPDENESKEVKETFQKKKVRINIKGIEEAILPELNDELAKRVGATNIATMREQLTKLLTKQSDEGRVKHLRDLVGEQLIEKVQFDIPASVLEKEANHRINQMFRKPDFVKKWNEEMSEDEKSAHKDQITKQSENAIKLFYICRRIVSQNNISLPEEEMTPSYETVLEMMFADPQSFNQKEQTKEQQAMEFSKFMMAKAEDFMIDKILNTGTSK